MLSTRSRWSVLSDRSYGAVLASREAHTRAGGLSAAQLAAAALAVAVVGHRIEARRRAGR
jgi:hypothetical protein